MPSKATCYVYGVGYIGAVGACALCGGVPGTAPVWRVRWLGDQYTQYSGAAVPVGLWSPRARGVWAVARRVSEL